MKIVVFNLFSEKTINLKFGYLKVSNVRNIRMYIYTGLSVLIRKKRRNHFSINKIIDMIIQYFFTLFLIGRRFSLNITTSFYFAY